MKDFLQATEISKMPVGELESALAAWFKQVCASNASIESYIIRDKAL
jgi:hypothetical protein